MVRKVRVGKVYRFNPNFMDLLGPVHLGAEENQKVRVINLHGAPPANTMGQCYIEDAHDGTFLGMVSCNSLEDV